VESPAVIYCRISDDRSGEGLGVERQRQDCLALAAGNDWPVTSVLIDNDVSAYSGKPRPAYRDLLAAIGAGQVGVVVAWHPDRLHRSPAELEHFIDLVETHAVEVVTVQAGRYDLSTPSGRYMARNLGNAARYESEHKSERVCRALEQNAANGKHHGRRAYGWQRAYDLDTGKRCDVIDPTEAEVVRRVAEQLISGHSLRGITLALNEAGVPSPTGKQWAKGMVRHVVLRERNAGLRVHHGQVIGDGAWEPILPRGTWEQVKAVLDDPQRRTAMSSGAKHLLSGIARCGVCGATIRGALNRTTESYRCSAKSCVSRARRSVDELVTGVVLGRLARADAAALLVPNRSGEVEQAIEAARGLRARLDLAADDYADGKIDRRQLERITARLRPQVQAAEARARVVDDSPLLDGLVGNEKAVAVWETLSLTRRRAVVDLLVDIRIMRTRPGAREFDPDTVQITWKDASPGRSR
jgi:DNA invertase Pin-like site-specific DNA recombinase